MAGNGCKTAIYHSLSFPNSLYHSTNFAYQYFIINGTLLNFGKRYEDDLRVIFDQWPKMHLGLDALSNQKS